MPLHAPLNERQVEVLRWIRDGCPDGRWENFSFKTTAKALASRRLVTVTKRAGVWSAAVLPAGEHYLSYGQYPAGHWVKRGRLLHTGTPLRPAVVPRHPVAASPVAPAETNKPIPPGELTPTRKLLKQLVDAEGVLEIDTRDESTSYRSLVGIINRRRMAPEGQEVVLVEVSYARIVLRLSSVTRWKTAPPSETVNAERISRWQPAVATLRGERRLDSIANELRGRGLRLLHALAREAEAREYSVRLPKRNDRGYVEDSSKLAGDLIIRVGDIDCSVDILQPNERVPHIPTQDELVREKKYRWPPSRYDYVPANRLTISIDSSSRFLSKIRFSDTKTLPLELRLPDVLMTFERWAIIDAERIEAERRAEIERREREAREDEQARRAYVEHALGEELVADANEWELAGRLRRYLAEMTVRVDQISEDDERDAALNWLAWCQEYAENRDPFSEPIRQPSVSPPDSGDLREFRQRLGFGLRW